MEYFAFQWHITEACDQRCKHCYIYALGAHAKFKEMALGDMVKVIENCQTFCEKAGRLNLNGFDRGKLLGGYVSKEQPSIIDDPTLKSGFYGAPTVCAIFGPKNFLYSIPDAFCCAENMVLAATELGLASCIVAETFDNEVGRELLRQWETPENYVARCFVLLGYCQGDYPASKERKPGQIKIVG